jgi:hypothetical protein
MIDFFIDFVECFAETMVIWILFFFNHKEWKRRFIDRYDFVHCPGGVNDTGKHNIEVDNEKTSI